MYTPQGRAGRSPAALSRFFFPFVAHVPKGSCFPDMFGRKRSSLSFFLVIPSAPPSSKSPREDGEREKKVEKVGLSRETPARQHGK